MKSFYFYLQVSLLVILGVCGLVLISIGAIYDKPLSVVIGCLALGLPLISIKDKNI